MTLKNTLKISLFILIFLIILYFEFILGYLFASQPLIFLLLVIAALLIPLLLAKYLFKYKFNKLSVIVLTLISLSIITYSFYTGLLESFCWRKGYQTVTTELLPGEKEYLLKYYNIESPSTWLIAYTRCQKDFDFTKAFKSVYLGINDQEGQSK